MDGWGQGKTDRENVARLASSIPTAQHSSTCPNGQSLSCFSNDTGSPSKELPVLSVFLDLRCIPGQLKQRTVTLPSLYLVSLVTLHRCGSFPWSHGPGQRLSHQGLGEKWNFQVGKYNFCCPLQDGCSMGLSHPATLPMPALTGLVWRPALWLRPPPSQPLPLSPRSLETRQLVSGACLLVKLWSLRG